MSRDICHTWHVRARSLLAVLAAVLTVDCGGHVAESGSSVTAGGTSSARPFPGAGGLVIMTTPVSTGGANSTGGALATGGANATCDDLLQSVARAFADFVSTNQSCSSDSDCVIVWNAASCLGGCGQPINGAALADAYSPRFCAPLQSTGCPVPTVNCPACGGPICDVASGSCACGFENIGTGGAAGTGGNASTGGATATGGTTTTGGMSGTDTRAVPIDHRPVAAPCPAQRGAGPTLSAGGECGQDSDCTGGINGRCLWDIGGNYCSYDTCFSDADCSSGQLCDCRESASSSPANECIAGACLTDTDCGPDGYCSPSVTRSECVCLACEGSASCPYVDHCGHGYFCHTPQDTCLNDSDCNGFKCAYDKQNKRWSCFFPSCPI